MHALQHTRQLAFFVRELRQGRSPDTRQTPQCTSCDKFREPGTKLLTCTQCKAVYYCNAQCSKIDWKGTPTQGGVHPSHKSQCSQMKASMISSPAMKAISGQFPWLWEQDDGTFDSQIVRAHLEILGTGSEFGWWTEEPCCNDRTPYITGSELLGLSFLSERKGWKLPDDKIPQLHFEERSERSPLNIAPVLNSWADYYEWRRLPLQSPACLLLHWPLSLYRLLGLLKLIPSEAPKERRKLTVHYIGVEKELDFMPIYGELAILLPNTDLDIVFFGQTVAGILAKAAKNPSCLASQEHAFSYTAPESLGSGTVRIALDKSGDAFWNIFGPNPPSKPDAILACNAGISTYPAWLPICIASRAYTIPFAVTDYNQITLENDIDLVLDHLLPLKGRVPGAERLKHSEVMKLQKPNSRCEIALNPFMSPGPRTRGPKVHRMPEGDNAFTMIVTPGPGAQ